jgi:RNA polymerase sigma factor (sigma-70 family)
MSDHTPSSSVPAGDDRFATTHWSVVLAAGSPSSSRYEQALGTLCQTYWFPIYAYLRRRGYDIHQAEDYTQGFFAGLLEKKGLRLADPERGKFRSYILGALKHFLADERSHASAQKRGGGRQIFSLDSEKGETQYALEPVHQLSPEKMFERSWALTVLQRSISRLEAESTGAHRQEVFQHLVAYLAPTGEVAAYRDTAAKLNISEGAVKAAVYRLRKRYRELLRDEIAQTVATEDQIEGELRDLFGALSS